MCKYEPIRVTSHVARDFLQNAAYFSTMSKIVWEYVANSLDNARDDVTAYIRVDITSNYITISDNGRGMSREELSNFFQMHGENIQRKRGKRVRGRFGTGKSAAFGLANCLSIDSTQAGLKNVVELHRRDIEQAKSGAPFPVRDILIDQATDEEDGTTVEIRELNIKRLDIDKVISYVERHLSRYRQRAHVIINSQVCKFEEPQFVDQFEVLPPSEVAQHVGEVTLSIESLHNNGERGRVSTKSGTKEKK